MKLSKVLSIIVLAVMILTIATNFAYATNPNSYKGNTSGTENVKKVGEQILGIIQVVGTIAAIAILVVLGVKYMMGSTEEKAEYKKTLIPYIVGAVLIFAASNIAGVLYDWANKIATAAS